MTWSVVVLAAVLLYLPVSFAVRTLRAGRRGGARDSIGLLAGLVSALVGVVLSHLLLPWEVLPPLLWALPVAAAVAGLIGTALAWRDLPWVAGEGRSRTLRIAGAVVEVAVSGGLLALALPG